MPPRFVFTGLLLTTSLTAMHPAWAKGDCLENVWKGSIGEADVTMKFEPRYDDTALLGKYYRVGSAAELVVTPTEDEPGSWQERDADRKLTGLLRLDCRGNQLSGSWSRPDGSGVVPVTAMAVAPDSYRALQMASLRPRVEKTIRLDGRRQYQLIGVPGVPDLRTVQVLGNSPGIGALNARLRASFQSALDEMLSCALHSRVERSPDNPYEIRYFTDILAYASGFIVIGQHADSYCGGAHGNTAQWAWTWNLASATVEDVSTWTTHGWPAPDTRLARLIDENSSALEGECRDAVTVTFDGKHLWPSNKGIVVLPEARDYTTRWCAVPFTLPYDLLWPYLGKTGKRNVASMKRSLPARQTAAIVPPR